MRLSDVFGLLAPDRCAACSRPGPTLCARCRGGARWQDGGQAPPAAGGLDACVTLLWLKGPALDWIHRFKYPARTLAGLDGPALRLVRALGRDLAGRLDPAAGDHFVPVPLHPRRLRARGFNPAGVLAVAAAAGRAPVDTRLLRRIRDTPSQAGLDRRARQGNVRGAFSCRVTGRPAPERVWLVDDVVTTGATLAAAAQALRGAGVRKVVGVGLARTPWPSETG